MKQRMHLLNRKRSMHYFLNCTLRVAFLGVVVGVSAPLAQSQIGLLFPQGLPIQQNSGPSFMMGGAAEGVYDDYNCMLRNPANLGFVDKTVFSSLYIFDFSRIAQSGRHTNFIQGFPEQISIGIPFGSFGTIGLSYNVLSNTAAKFRSPQESVDYDTSAETYQPGLAATGGTTAWQVGWGRDLPKLKHLRIGLSYERVYYSASRSVVRVISDPSKTMESRDSTYDELRTNGLRAGLMLPLGKFKAGVSGEYFFGADLHRNNAIYSNSSDTVGPRGLTAAPVDQKLSSGGVRMPPSLSLGISYAINTDWLAAADVSSTFWDLYYSHGFLAATRTNALSVSGGAQYVPISTLMAPRYWETIHYSAGLRYSQLPAKQSSELALTLGTGLPIGRGRGLLTLGLEAGRRTDSHYGDISENFVHFAIGINGSRKWNKSSLGNY